MTPELAARLATIVLGHIRREYPHKLDHVLDGDDDARSPRALHPLFFGSFDWHSCVHGYWTLARLLRAFPDLPQAAAIRALFDDSLVMAKTAGELAYLDRRSSAGFERPYGWAWLLALHGELERHTQPWAATLAPLAAAFAARFHGYLPRLTYPVRAGTHANTAFALILAAGWARERDAALTRLIGERARAWFGCDRDAQAWEPSGDDFLSGTLTEAVLMRAVLAPGEFAAWFALFLPHLAERRPAGLFTPATVSDPSDGKIAHLDGLNFSRAWCWRAVASGFPHRQVLERSAEAHVEASLPNIAADYAGEHWLATFVLMALTGTGSD